MQYHMHRDAREQCLEDVLEVYRKYQMNEDWVRSYQQVAKDRGVEAETIRDACTRRLGLNVEEFCHLLDNPEKLSKHLRGRFPELECRIEDAFSLE